MEKKKEKKGLRWRKRPRKEKKERRGKKKGKGFSAFCFISRHGALGMAASKSY